MNAKKKLLYRPPATEDYSKNFCKLYIVIAISFVFISAQFVGGYISGSISVISDAFHLVTDLIGFAVSFAFISISRREPTQKMTFGYHRMELLGALGNLFIIWTLAIFLIYEATLRIIDKQFVAEPVAMLIVGVGGLAVNIVMYFVLHSGDHSHGLMSQQCDHNHGPHDNDPNPSNCTTSFCNQLVCQDQICLKQVNSSHCHVKDIKGEVKIHLHDNNRKLSDQLAGEHEQGLNNSLNKFSVELKTKKQHNHNGHDNENLNENKEQKAHVHGQNCFGNHEKNAQKQHKHSHSQEHKHSHEQHSSHHHSKSPQKQHKHSQNCKHDHGNQHDHGNEHEHNENCKHEHIEKLKQKHSHDKNCKHDNNQKKTHDHKHDHAHDHAHGHEHDENSHKEIHHDHQGHEHGDAHQSISMQAAVLHAFSDVIQSIGLLISSLFIFFLGSNKGAHVTQWNDWHYFDPISTYVFSIIVVISTFPIVKNCYFIIMQATPSTQKVRKIKQDFEETPGVVDVHDLHVWDLRPGKTLLIAHVFAKDGCEREVLTSLTQICRKSKIFHSTLQVEQQNWKNHDEYILCDHDIH